MAIAERAWGCALGRLGHPMAEVEHHFAAALAICRRTEQVKNGSQTEVWWGRICRERGDEAAAQRHFAEARRQIESGGYEYALEELRRFELGI